jgi:hypothetical protein
MIRSRYFYNDGETVVYFLVKTDHIMLTSYLLEDDTISNWVHPSKGIWMLQMSHGQVTLMSGNQTDLCPFGHTWNYQDDKCTTCGMSFDDYRAAKPWGQSSVKCECGSDVAGFTSHAYYCPKHVGDK